MIKESTPEFWLIGGANGSGKSTLINIVKNKLKNAVDVINPDNIANQLEPENTVHHSLSIQMEAGKQAIRLQKEALEKRETFAIETTFSSKREILLLKQTKELGYKTNLIYIGLENSGDNLERIEARIKEKGHFVSSKDVQRRYQRSMDNLKINYQLFDRVILLDNSKKIHTVKAKIINQRIVRAAPISQQPKWVLDSIPDIKIFMDNKQTRVKQLHLDR